MIGRIYKIIHNQSNIIYVGSTLDTLRNRWQGHKSGYKQVDSSISIYSYFKEHGIDNFKIMLIKEYEVVDKRHLHVYETLWINKLKSINKNNPFRINWLSYKDYQAKNKARIAEYQKAYYENNKASIAEQKKDYQAKNKAKIAEKDREKFNCSCGGKYTHANKARHFKSKKHINFIESQ